MIKQAIDTIGAAPPFEAGDTPRRIGILALAFLGLAMLQALFRFGSRMLILGQARRAEHDLRRAYFAHLVRLPPGYLQAARKGDLVSRAIHDVQDVRLFLGAGVLNFLQTLILMFTATGLLWRENPALTLAALSPFPLITWLVKTHAPHLHQRYLEADRREGGLSALVQETLSGIRVLRAYGREQWQAERFEQANTAVRDARAQVVRTWAKLFPAVTFLATAGLVAVLGYGGHLVAKGEMTLGGFVAFNVYLAMLTWPMIAMGWTLSLLQRGRAAMDRIDEVMGVVPWSEGDRSPRDDAPPLLEANRISFTYPNAEAATLDGISLRLEPGQFHGLVGGTGCGKSTLAALLSGLQRPDVGQVRWAEVELASLDPKRFHAELAVVPQDGYLFADTVAQNITLGRPRDPERLAWALEVAGLTDEVAGFSHGVKTAVGEGGVTLSGGQQQRVGLARALYGQPRALILDGSLSNLDARTARTVVNNLHRALPGVSLLLISHRGVEVEGADTVSFLDNGRIAARGSHEELMASTPAYARLYREEALRRALARDAEAEADRMRGGR